MQVKVSPMNAIANTQLDRHVAPLVKILNNLGPITCSSCHGHGFPINRPPFVVFTTSEAIASKISKVLRDDSESEHPMLLWGWLVDGLFDQEHKLNFRITTQNPHRPIYRWMNWTVHKDLKTLCWLLEDAVRKINPPNFFVSMSQLSSHL